MPVLLPSKSELKRDREEVYRRMNRTMWLDGTSDIYTIHFDYTTGEPKDPRVKVLSTWVFTYQEPETHVEAILDPSTGKIVYVAPAGNRPATK